MINATALPLPHATRACASAVRRGLRDVLGATAWARLPAAVRERFADAAHGADYAGSFEVVRANWLGRVVALIGKFFGQPVATRVGEHVEARVQVRPDGRGSQWLREYRWPNGSRDLVTSTKIVNDDLTLTERLPARLCMPLVVFESGGVLHFVSRSYYFDFGRIGGRELRLPLPTWLAPGVTHVEHIDLGHGWFRFTMTVTHPVFGEVFFQTGRFCDTE